MSLKRCLLSVSLFRWAKGGLFFSGGKSSGARENATHSSRDQGWGEVASMRFNEVRTAVFGGGKGTDQKRLLAQRTT